MKSLLKSANHGFWLRLSFQLLLALVSKDEDEEEDGQKRYRWVVVWLTNVEILSY